MDTEVEGAFRQGEKVFLPGTVVFARRGMVRIQLATGDLVQSSEERLLELEIGVGEPGQEVDVDNKPEEKKPEKPEKGQKAEKPAQTKHLSGPPENK